MNAFVYDPIPALKVLVRHRVRFIIIGGFAGNVLGSPMATFDLDICYARDYDNLEQLAAALQELKAKLRGAPEDVPFILDAKTLEMGDHFTFTTTVGSVDVLGTPAGTRGYDDLDRVAEAKELNGLTVKVASIDDLIRMKRAAGRPKDLIQAEVLGALREEIEREE